MVDVPDAPNSLALSDDIVWVSTRAGTVGIPPGQDKELIERGRDTTQGGRAVGEQGDVLWVPIPEENKVVSLSARTGAPRDTTITTANRPKALAFTDDQVLVSESDGATTRVERYDAEHRRPHHRLQRRERRGADHAARRHPLGAHVGPRLPEQLQRQSGPC